VVLYEEPRGRSEVCRGETNLDVRMPDGQVS
jgi:hypothetical protein